jgi:cell division protein FtsL
MAVEKYKVLPNRKTADQDTYAKEIRKTRKTVGIRRFEMMVYLILSIIIAVVAFYVLSLKMDAYQLQSEVVNLEGDIATTENEIGELNTEVTDLQSYDRIYEKANDLGLDLDNGNVKVVERYDKD